MANVISNIRKLTKLIELLDSDWNDSVDLEIIYNKIYKWKSKYAEDFYVKKAKCLNIIFEILEEKVLTEQNIHLMRQIAFYYQYRVPYCVYKHTSPNGKIYFGITCQEPETRWLKGNGYIDNTLFYKDICRYGWDNIKHDILYDDLDEFEAAKIERELIELNKTANESYGYNIDKGGKRPSKPKLWEYDRYYQWHQSRKIFKLIISEEDLPKYLNSKIYTMDIFYTEKIINKYNFNIYFIKGYPHETRGGNFDI